MSTPNIPHDDELPFLAIGRSQFQDSGENCLQVKIGDIIKVVEIDQNSEWWGGYLARDPEERTGWFPGQTVVRLSGEEEREYMKTGRLDSMMGSSTSIATAGNSKNHAKKGSNSTRNRNSTTNVIDHQNVSSMSLTASGRGGQQQSDQKPHFHPSSRESTSGHGGGLLGSSVTKQMFKQNQQQTPNTANTVTQQTPNTTISADLQRKDRETREARERERRRQRQEEEEARREREKEREERRRDEEERMRQERAMNNNRGGGGNHLVRGGGDINNLHNNRDNNNNNTAERGPRNSRTRYSQLSQQGSSAGGGGDRHMSRRAQGGSAYRGSDVHRHEVMAATESDFGLSASMAMRPGANTGTGASLSATTTGTTGGIKVPHSPGRLEATRRFREQIEKLETELKMRIKENSSLQNDCDEVRRSQLKKREKMQVFIERATGQKLSLTQLEGLEDGSYDYDTLPQNFQDVKSKFTRMSSSLSGNGGPSNNNNNSNSGYSADEFNLLELRFRKVEKELRECQGRLRDVQEVIESSTSGVPGSDKDNDIIHQLKDLFYSTNHGEGNNMVEAKSSVVRRVTEAEYKQIQEPVNYSDDDSSFDHGHVTSSNHHHTSSAAKVVSVHREGQHNTARRFSNSYSQSQSYNSHSHNSHSHNSYNHQNQNQYEQPQRLSHISSSVQDPNTTDDYEEDSFPSPRRGNVKQRISMFETKPEY